MKEWFTIEKIDGETYALSEYGHWEQTHTYLLLGDTRALLIDTGLGVADIGAKVKALTSLPVTVALTHAHWDHIGGLKFFPDFAMHEAEEKWLREKFPLSPAAVRENLLKEACDFPEDFSAEKYRIFQGSPSRLLKDGDSLDLGNRRLTVLHTPGHSPGHLCYYEEERGYLFSGDLLYSGQLDAFYPTTDPEAFLSSLLRIRELPFGKLLPGHYALDIPAALGKRAAAGISSLKVRGLLKHGSGTFVFEGFCVRL